MVQKFLIEIYPKNQTNSFIVKLKSNLNLTYLKAHIHFLENFKYYPNLKFDIIQSIYNAMIRQKFLILRLDKIYLMQLMILSYPYNKIHPLKN